jgi:hypothetical protein
MSEVSEVLKHAREREGKVDHEYEIEHTSKWIDIGRNGERVMRDVDMMDVYRQENGRTSAELMPDFEESEWRDIRASIQRWRLKPGTYLVVRLKKEPRETDYRVMAYCYRVNEDGTAIKKEVINKSVSPFYTDAWDYARGLRNEINCDEYFK